MTLIVALKARDAIVMAADSRATIGDPRGLTAISDDQRKLSSIGFCGVGLSGAAELGRSLLDELSKRSFPNNLDADKVVARLADDSARLFTKWFREIPPESRPAVLVIVAGFRSRRDREPEPLIYLLNSQSNFAPQLFANNPCMAGVPQYAIYLANRYYAPSISKQQAKALAHYLISETASQDTKVGGPIQIAEVTAQHGYVEVSEDEIAMVEAKNKKLNTQLHEFFVTEEGSSVGEDGNS